MLSTPYIRLTSSIKSSFIDISNLLVGTFTITFSPFTVYVNPNFLNTFNISSSGITVPNTSFTFLNAKSISFSLFSVSSYFTVPVTTLPFAYFSSNVKLVLLPYMF